MRLKRVVIILALLCLFLPRAASSAGSTVKVIVLPFEMHSKEEISDIRRLVMDIFATGLKEKGGEIVGIKEIKALVFKGKTTGFDESAALEIAGKAPADFALLGSITKLGHSLNVDFRVFDLKERETVAFFSRSASAVPGLASAAMDSVKDVYTQMVSTLETKPAVKKGVIDRIVIRGNRRVDTEAIRRKLNSTEGAVYSPDDVREEIRALYSTGFFENITVGLSDTSSGKILTITVKEMPFIKKIKIKGNKELDTKKVLEIVTIKENTVLDRASVGENTERIKALYAKEGYYLAEVTPEITSEGVEATVTFNIKEGGGVRVKRITILGNSHFSDRQIRSVMETKQSWLFSFVTQSGRFDEFVFQNDLAQILGKYFDNGFITADITGHRVLLSPDRRWFYITISLTEGEQYRVGKIGIEGDILGSREALFGKLKTKEGEIFSRTTLSRDIETLTDRYGDDGYAYVEIKPQTKIHADLKTVDITFNIKKNELVYIERVNISGNTRTRDKVIRREIEVEEEELYGSTAVKRSRSNLKRLGFFDDVKIGKSRASAPNRINLDVDVKERPTGSISAGIGYSSVDKIIGTASISQANFMGTGIKLDLSGTLSASSTKFIFGLTEPWLFDKPISAGIDIYNTEREFPDFTTRRKGFDVRLGFPIYKRTTRGYLAYTLEEVKVFDVAADASTFIRDQEGINTESSVQLTLKRDTRDDAFFPRHGSVVTFTSKFAGGPIGGSIYMIKNDFTAAKYLPLPWDITLSLRGTVGYIQGYAGREPPIYERYFLGGINTIRGFDTRSISPKDPATGDLIGGNSMVTVNTELVFPLFPAQKLRGLVFFDAGNSYKGRIDMADIRTGVGFGVRWYSPMGPLRLELGFNLDRRDDEKSSQFDFTIGTAF